MSSVVMLLLQFGSDKPDTRIGLQVPQLKRLMGDCTDASCVDRGYYPLFTSGLSNCVRGCWRYLGVLRGRAFCRLCHLQPRCEMQRKPLSRKIQSTFSVWRNSQLTPRNVFV